MRWKNRKRGGGEEERWGRGREEGERRGEKMILGTETTKSKNKNNSKNNNKNNNKLQICNENQNIGVA